MRISEIKFGPLPAKNPTQNFCYKASNHYGFVRDLKHISDLSGDEKWLMKCLE